MLKWWGKPGKAIHALEISGFLDKTDDGYIAHRFSERQGHIWMIRERNRKVAINRWRKARGSTTGIPLVYHRGTTGIPRSFPSPTTPTLPEDRTKTGVLLSEGPSLVVSKGDGSGKGGGGSPASAQEASEVAKCRDRPTSAIHTPKEVDRKGVWRPYLAYFHAKIKKAKKEKPHLNQK